MFEGAVSCVVKYVALVPHKHKFLAILISRNMAQKTWFKLFNNLQE